jgi:hypothetical protein
VSFEVHTLVIRPEDGGSRSLICWYLFIKLHSGTSQKTMLKFKPMSGQNGIDEYQQLSSNQSTGRDRHSSYQAFHTCSDSQHNPQNHRPTHHKQHTSTAQKIPQIICSCASIPCTSIKRSHSCTEIPFWQQGKLETFNLYGMHPSVLFTNRYNLKVAKQIIKKKQNCAGRINPFLGHPQAYTNTV